MNNNKSQFTTFNRLDGIQKSVHTLAVIAIATSIFYASYFLNLDLKSNLVVYIWFVITEAYTILFYCFSWWTITSYKLPANKIRNDEINLSKIRKYTVDVFIPVVSEPLEIIEYTVSHVVEMDFKHNTYLLDDKGREDLVDLARKYNIEYIHRNNHEFYKSGNVNNGIRQTNGEFIVIFDADFAPHSDFLVKTLPLFEDSNVSFVQTPQFYRDTLTYTSKAASIIQNVFYELIMPGKNSFNAAFCVGTNVVFRRSALEQVGLISQVDHSEDLFTSLELHKKGWKSIYIPDILAEGLAPDNLDAYWKQQYRWARGGFDLLINHNPIFIKTLSIDQKIQYMSSAFYLSGLVILTYILMPIIYLLFGQKPIEQSLGNINWFIHYLPFFALNLFITSYAMRGFKFKALVIAVSTFPIYIKALFDTLISDDYKWEVTNSKKKRNNISLIFPHISIIILSICAVFIGIIRYEDLGTTISCIIWTILTSMIFISIIVVHLDIKNSLKFNFFKPKK